MNSEVAAETAARNGLWVCVVMGAVTAFAAAAGAIRVPAIALAVGLSVFLYFVVVAVGVGAGSRLACVIAILYVLPNLVSRVPIVPIILTFLLIGSLRAALALRTFRRKQASSTAPPELPESHYRESAPEHLRRLAEADERGLLTRLIRLWRRTSPGGEIVLGSLTLLVLSLAATGLYLTRNHPKG